MSPGELWQPPDGYWTGREPPYGYAYDGAPAGAPSHDLWHYLDVLRRRWWLIAGAALIAVGAAWWSQRDYVPEYTAEVLLRLEPEQPVVGDVPRSGPPDVDFGSHLDILRSRPVLGPVVDSAGLQLRLQERASRRTEIIADVEAERAAPRGAYVLERAGGEVRLRAAGGDVLSAVEPGSVIEGPGFRLRLGGPGVLGEPLEFSIRNFDDAFASLENDILIEEGSGPSLIWIYYTHPDPDMAARVVNAAARSYQDHRATGAREDAARRREAIAEQLVALQDSLERVKDELVTFQEERIPATGAGGAVRSDLRSAERELIDLRFDEEVLATIVAGFETSGSGDESLNSVMALGADLIPQGQELTRRLQDLQLQRAELTAGQFGLTENASQVQALDAQIDDVKEQIRIAADKSLDLIRRQLAAAEGRFGELAGQVSDMPGLSAELEQREQRVAAIQQIFDELRARYYEAQISEGIEAGDIEIVGLADPPVRPDPSRANLFLLIALVVGLVVGIVAALLLDQLDSSVRQAGDVERVAQVEVIGLIPNIRELSSDSEAAQIGKEGFRALRTHLRFAPAEQPRLIAVTSPTPRDGKSTVASNLALTLAEQGSRTVLIDGDLRRPQVHTTFGIDPAPGLSDLLRGRADLDMAARPCPAAPQLHIIPAGSPVPNPTELVGSEAFERLLADVSNRYDSVVIDTPPLLSVSDAALTAALVDGTLVVVRANKTDQAALENAINQLRRMKATVLGVVMNGVPTRRAGYYYPAHYYDEEPGADVEKRPLLQPAGSVEEPPE